MSFHPDKCTVMHVSRSRTKLETDYYLHGKKIEKVTSAKYLGVTLQDDGEWEEHITNVANAGNKTIGFFRRNIRVNSISTKYLAYMMRVFFLLRRCSTISFYFYLVQNRFGYTFIHCIFQDTFNYAPTSVNIISIEKYFFPSRSMT